MTAALRTAVESAGLPVKALAAQMGLPRASYLSDALNEHHLTQFQARWLVPFMRETKSLAPLRWLATELGCAVVQLPAVTIGAGQLRDRFLHAVEEIGKDSAAIQRALADGEMTANEGRDVVAELSNTVDVLREVMAMVEAKVTKPVPARMTLPAPSAIERRA